MPELSEIVRVAVRIPTLLQSKLVVSRVLDAIPQLSELPPSTSATVMEAWLLVSRETVTSWQTAVGAMVSRTTKVALQVEELPAVSVTVSTTPVAGMKATKSLVLRVPLAVV